VFGVVVTVVVGDDDDGGAGDSDASALGGGAGAGGAGAGGAGTGSLSTAGPLGAGAGGVVTAGAAAGCATGAAVVGTGWVSDCAGRSPSLSRTVTDPKPTSSAATHASESKIAHLPMRWEKARRLSSSAAGSVDSAVKSSCRCGPPSASGGPMGSVGSSTSGTPRALTGETDTAAAFRSQSSAKPAPRTPEAESSPSVVAQYGHAPNP